MLSEFKIWSLIGSCDLSWACALSFSLFLMAKERSHRTSSLLQSHRPHKGYWEATPHFLPASGYFCMYCYCVTLQQRHMLPRLRNESGRAGNEKGPKDRLWLIHPGTTSRLTVCVCVCEVK